MAGGSGDPHFIQPIRDKLQNVTKFLCYDVTGKSNEFIKIFTDSQFKTEVYGQLKDDYFMHNVLLKLRNHTIRIKANEIDFSSRIRFKWDDKQILTNNWLRFNNFFYRLKNNMVLVKTNKVDKITYGVMRKIDKLKKYYLDIALFGLSGNYSGKGGLMGKIGNKNISILPTVQSKDAVKATLIVDGRKTFGLEMKRNGEKCIFVPANNLLSPTKANEFLLENF